MHQRIGSLEIEEKLSILFLGKHNDEHTSKALSFCEANFSDVQSSLGRFGDSRGKVNFWWDGDYIISYLSPWIVPPHMLQRARLAAINFHPASPDYPGIGCNNFALYDGATTYGATCHHMAAEVDCGKIIAVKRFAAYATDTVESILSRTHDHQLSLFYDVMDFILTDRGLPTSDETWTRKPYTRSELNELATIRPDMTKEEVERRIRATTFGDWKPTTSIHGHVFELKAESRKP